MTKWFGSRRPWKEWVSGAGIAVHEGHDASDVITVDWRPGMMPGSRCSHYSPGCKCRYKGNRYDNGGDDSGERRLPRLYMQTCKKPRT